jgi:hypothetical protein
MLNTYIELRYYFTDVEVASYLSYRLAMHKAPPSSMQKKRLFWEKGQRWVTLKVSARALRTIKKKGLDVMAEEKGIDLNKLPYNDVSEARLQWKAANSGAPPMAKNSRCDL